MFLKTLTIFDWDDTLFPTIQYINHNNVEFERLDYNIYSLFSFILNYSQIIIITDANKEWFIKCIQYLNYTKQLINENQIKILSTRDIIKEYETIYNKDLLLKNRKIKIFKCVLLLFPEFNNIISIGDSEKEYEALINLYKINKNESRYFKNIKLFKYPNSDLILEEIKLLKNNYFDIYKIRENKDIVVKLNKQIIL